MVHDEHMHTTTLTADIAAILAKDGWTKPWNMPNVTNYHVDEYGNRAAIHENGEMVRIEFEYALPGVVETLNLCPSHGAARIAAVISALAVPME